MDDLDLKVFGKLLEVGLSLRGIHAIHRVQLNEEWHCTCSQPVAQGRPVGFAIGYPQQQAA